MNENEVVEFLKQKEDESVRDYLTRTHDIYYARAYARLNTSIELLKEIKNNLEKLQKSAKNGNV